MTRTPTPTAVPSRTDLDVATGVLVGLRGGTTSDAHDELLHIARQYRLSLPRLARSLITLAEGDREEASRTGDVARLLWDGMVRERDLGRRPRLGTAS